MTIEERMTLLESVIAGVMMTLKDIIPMIEQCHANSQECVRLGE
ncbi:unnamed protein product, partial [marine sediment metagenome]